MRLIDADKLDWWYKGRRIRRVIDEAPTVDAVEVVRCKDCKHYHRMEEGFMDCNNVYGIDIPGPDDFCSYGERKEQ